MLKDSVYKSVTKLELQDTKVSTKGVQRLIIIPKDQHYVIDQLKDVEYVFEVSICEASLKTEKLSLRIIGKVSKMGGQRQIFIPIRFHKDLEKLKDKKYLIIISIQEI